MRMQQQRRAIKQRTTSQRGKWGLLLCIVFALGFLSGCGDDGKYQVTGAVSFQGQPVPSGEIRFTPDKGNEGPMVLARIKEGRYETPKDKGLVGGHYQLRISGFGAAGNAKDPTAPDFGKPLFPVYREDVEFPQADFEHDIEVK